MRFVGFNEYSPYSFFPGSSPRGSEPYRVWSLDQYLCQFDRQTNRNDINTLKSKVHVVCGVSQI